MDIPSVGSACVIDDDRDGIEARCDGAKDEV
jgi:hypothetical protein